LEKSVTRRLNRWRNDQWSTSLETLYPEDQSQYMTTKRVVIVPTPSSHILVTPWGIAEELADSLETNFQPIPEPSLRAFFEMDDLALRSWFLTPDSQPTLPNPAEVHEAIGGLKVNNAPSLNDIPNRALKYLLQQSISLLAQIINAVLRTYPFPQVWKHDRVISIFKPGNFPTLPSSYPPISLFDTIVKLFEKIPLVRILHVVSGRGLM